MFLSSVGQASEVDMFAYYLCEKLGRTLSDLDDMPVAEYVGWSSYYKVKRQQEDLAAKVANRG